MTDRPDEQAVPPGNDDQINQSAAENSAPPDTQPPTGSSSERGDEQKLWVVPENALTLEQAEALRAEGLIENITGEDLPGVEPAQDGGWFTPPNAITLGEIDNVLDSDFVGGIQPAADVAPDVFEEADAPIVLEDSEPAVEENPAPIIEDEEPEIPVAPIEFGKADFQNAPAGPVDSAEEAGLGGLRDKEKPGLTPDQVRDAEQIAPLVPARGLGGVRGGVHDSEATRVLSDTGQVSGQTPPPSATGPLAPPQAPAQPDPQAQKFRDVEQAVTGLRQQYANGMISRPQLEAELRKLIVLDNQGRWWTIGVDSNRWYRYDGREWIPDTPPQAGPMVPYAPTGGGGVRDQYVPTETNVPMPQTTSPRPQIELDDYGMPLPQKVPVDDPQATMVNLNAATSSNEESTWGPTVASHAVSNEVIASPAGQTIASPSTAEAAEATLSGSTRMGGHDSRPVGAIEQPKQKGVQPDYSAAYGRKMDRSSMSKMAVWVGIGGVVLSLGMVLCLLLGMVAYYFSVVNQYQERLDAVGQRASSFQSTKILDADGNVLAQYNDPNTGARTDVALEDVSPWLLHATIATEDESFYDNPGFSVYAIIRAVVTNLRSEGPRSGASTITQQLVRALVLDEEFAADLSANRKITEIILAAELNRKYTKNEILELYLNEIHYGNLAYGIEAASQVYFKKSAADLNIYEAAFLAGLPQAPAFYDPVRNRTAALGRMQTVMSLMTQAGDTGCIQFQGLSTNVEGFDLSAPLCIDQATFEGPTLAVEKATIETTLFEPPSFQPRYGHFVNWIWSELERQYNVQDIYSTGFVVYTTLKPDLQATAQQAVNDQIATARSRGFSVNNGSVVVMDPMTGAVTAMVGSADFNNEQIDGQVNVALSPQQPGSSIKPLVYLTALEGRDDGQYWTPASVIWDTETCWGEPGTQQYCPTNFDLQFRGPVAVRRALSNSLNVPAVKALDYVSPSRFGERAEELGLEFPATQPNELNLTAALGGFEVYLLDMVKVYSAFATQGQRFAPYGIERIETPNGDVIFQHTPEVDGIGMRPQHAYLINNILSDNNTRAEEFGRGAPLEIAGREVAVKTGTTNENRDNWTIGWTPQVIVGVWMGNTDNSPTGGSTGYTTAAPVWNRVIEKALEGLPPVAFPRPEGIQGLQVCTDTGAQVPPSGCGAGGISAEFFWVNQPPPAAGEGLIELVSIDPFTNLRANQYCPDFNIQATFLRSDDGTAAQWLQNTAAGQQWAASRGLDISVALTEPPEGECQPNQERPEVLLTLPSEGQVISGLAEIRGTATVPNFEYYELQYASFGTEQYVTIDRFNIRQTGQNTFLGQWNTSTIPDGSYTVRLVAVSSTGAQASDTASVSISNGVQNNFVPEQPTATVDPFGEGVPQGESGTN